MNRPEKPALLALLAGACGLCLFVAFCHPMLRGNVYQGSDLGAFHLPARSFYSHCLKNGFSFLWWPEQFCGYYIHGEGQVGMYHPLHLALYRFLPLDWAFNLEMVSGYMFLYAGMTFFLRRWRLPWFACLFGANLFTFSGFTLIHFIHMQAIEVIAHLPWLLLATDILLKSQSPRETNRAAMAVSLLFASQLLLGYPQYVLFTLMALALYVVAHGPTKATLLGSAWLSGALGLGLLIGAVQLLPTFDLVGDVQRQHADDFWRSGSLPPVNLLQVAGPYFFENRLAAGTPPWEYGLYTGMAPLVLGLFLLSQIRSDAPHRRLVTLCAVQVVLMLVLALGEYGGVYNLMAKLPLIGSFRCAARHIVLIHLALACLGAMGLARIMEPRNDNATHTARPLIRTALILATVAWVVAIALNQWADEATRSAITDAPHWMAVGPVLLVIAALTVGFALRRPMAGTAILMVFATLDIGAYALPQVFGHRPQSTPLDAMTTALAPELPEDDAFQPYSGSYRAHGNWRVSRLSALGLANYMGYVGLPPSWQLDPDAATTKLVAGVRWEKRPLTARDWTIHEDALPMARLVTQTKQSNEPAVDLENIDVTTTALVEDPQQLPGGVPGTVAWLHNRPGDVALRTSGDHDQLLVFAQRYHAGWQATVNDRPAQVLRVNGDFMGCVVPPGVADVQLHFSPPSHRIGATLSLVGLAILAVWGAWRIAQSRPNHTKPQP